MTAQIIPFRIPPKSRVQRAPDRIHEAVSGGLSDHQIRKLAEKISHRMDQLKVCPDEPQELPPKERKISQLAKLLLASEGSLTS